MIDYRKLADSLDFYENLGYKRIEAPWWVSQEIMNITAPKDKVTDYYLPANKKTLVASGEQSFLYTAVKGRLPKGRYQTVTPCFRDESIGITHKKCFMKNELIITDRVDQDMLRKVIEQAEDFFKTQVPDVDKLKVVQTDQGYDIEYGGIEIGSYGIRSCEFLDWIYATGCAEPRLTRAIVINEKRKK
jgi:hypothetical protein